jgi:hypothetical protein
MANHRAQRTSKAYTEILKKLALYGFIAYA